MSGYTPHTDDVAMAYVHATNGDTWVAGRADALRAEFYRWLAEHDREVEAEAWGEGHWEGWQNAREALLTDMFGGPTLNPYRQGETK